MNKSADHKRVLLTGFSPFQYEDNNKQIIDVKINASIEAVNRINKEDLERSLDITLYTAEVPVVYNYIDQKIPRIWKEIQPDLSIHCGVWGEKCSLKLEKLARKHEYEIEDNFKKTPHENKNMCDGPDVIATDLPVKLISDIYVSEVIELKKAAGKYTYDHDDNIVSMPHEGNKVYLDLKDTATDLPLESICDIYNREVEGFIKTDVSEYALKYTYEDNVGNTTHEENYLYPDPEHIATDQPEKQINNIYNCELDDGLLTSIVSEDAGKYICEYIYYTSLCLQEDRSRHSLFIHVPPEQKNFEAISSGLERLIRICVDIIRHQEQYTTNSRQKRSIKPEEEHTIKPKEESTITSKQERTIKVICCQIL